MVTEKLDEIVKQAATWPPEDQDELADYARVIEARRTGLYRVSASERAALEQAADEADRGDFASEEAVAAADKRHGV